MPYHTNVENHGPWQPIRTCPFCGSTNLRVGCQYQDCEECEDVEYSECRNCGMGFGGANYWQAPGSTNSLLERSVKP